MPITERQRLQESRRRMVMEALDHGFTARDAAAQFNCSLRSVKRWRRLYRLSGLPAVSARAWPCKKEKLDSYQRAQLLTMLDSYPSVFGYDGQRWSHSKIAKLIEDKFRVHYHRDHIPRLLEAIRRPPPVPPAPDSGQGGPPPLPPDLGGGGPYPDGSGQPPPFMPPPRGGGGGSFGL
ncbi:MAG TPA: helix-turn-helix domain-containing protein [Planctomycetota bacterium]|nr:helix-turn-helix domain-containing protein [Planctomycetota bacterium]